MTREAAAVAPVEPFGLTPSGRPARLYTLRNGHLRVRITDYGGRIVAIEAPGRDGHQEDIVLGFADAAGYAKAGGAFGALLGRTANRIAGGVFTLDGHTYQLATNEGSSTLHGGPGGFDQLSWDVISATAGPTPRLVLSHVSPDGDQGFPGKLSVEALYRLEGDSLWLEFKATTTQATPVSLSAHPYFNLDSDPAHGVLDHRVAVESDTYLPTDELQIPTGEMRSVAGTPFDFREMTRLGARICQDDPQLLNGMGYDHYFVLRRRSGPEPHLAARATGPMSGRVLELHTTQPGLQLYTGNQLNGTVVGRGGIYRQSAGFAFEPQGFPDAPHHPPFPSTILRPGETYSEVIRYRLTVSGCDAST